MKLSLCFFILIFSSCSTIETNYTKIDVQGHRGARSVYPENSLIAFQYALEIGVDTLELDLGVTKDNIVVVYHDQLINHQLCQYRDGRALQEGIPLHSLTFAELKELDCGALGNKRFPQQKKVPLTEIPSLEEVFHLISQSKHPHAAKIKFNIETKSKEEFPNYQPTPEKFISLILKVIDDFKLRERVTIQSFDHRTLKAGHKLAPMIKRAALFYERPAGDLVQATREAHGDILSPYYAWLTKKDVEHLQRHQIAVIPWTINDHKNWLKLIKMGVDGIITDDPAPLLKLLGR